MKVVFIRCATESLGIEYLSAALKAAGHETYLVYEPLLFNSFRLDLGSGEKASAGRAAARALALKPDLVAFSVESDYYGWALGVAGIIKKRGSVPVIFGGIHPTVTAEKALTRPETDFICVGEGEKALPALCGALEKGSSIEGIPNIWGHENGRPVKNRLELIENLDLLPFPDKDLFYREFKGFINDSYSIVTGRGCRNACTYCHNSSLRRTYETLGVKGRYERRRSAANVIAELSAAKTRYGSRRVSFCDDLFISDKPWLREFSTRYRAEIGLPFFCNIHPAHADSEAVSLLKEAGCSAVTIGVQTVSEPLRRERLARTETTAVTEAALRTLKDAEMFVYTNFIFGLPGQDEDELKEIVRFSARNPAGFHDVNWLRYYPASRIMGLALEEGTLTGEEALKIEEGSARRLYAHGGHSYTPARARLRNLVFLSNLISGRAVLKLLDSGLYGRLPSFTLRTPAIIAKTLAAKYFGGMTHPYPNFSISGSLRYFLHYLRLLYVPELLRSLSEAILFRLKTALNACVRLAFLARLLTLSAAARYAAYLFKTRLLGRRIPGTAMIALTFDCQCACACCSSAIFRERYAGSAMDFETAAARLREVIELGVPRVHFTGGEASLFARLPELVELCFRAGVTVFVETNGFGADKASVSALKKAGLASLNISLDSASSPEHDALRKTPGCHAAALNAIRLASELRQKCMVSVYATPRTIADGTLKRLVAFARASGADAVRVLPPVASGGWFDNFPDSELEPGAPAAIEELTPLFYPVLNRTAVIKCDLPEAYKIFILPDGAFAPCEHLPYVFAGSAGMRLSAVLDRMKEIPLLNERYDCWPRDAGFRKKHFPAARPSELIEL